jgi:hypothetical protein
VCLYLYAEALAGLVAALADGDPAEVGAAFVGILGVFLICRNPKTPDSPDPNNPARHRGRDRPLGRPPRSARPRT